MNDIARNRGVKRNSFSHHFESISDLLKWTFEQKAIEFFTEALAGMLINRVREPQKHNWQGVLDYMESIVQSMIPSALRSPAARQRP